MRWCPYLCDSAGDGAEQFAVPEFILAVLAEYDILCLQLSYELCQFGNRQRLAHGAEVGAVASVKASALVDVSAGAANQAEHMAELMLAVGPENGH